MSHPLSSQHRLAVFALTVGLIVSLVPTASAQAPRGSIVAKVVDSTGAVLPGVTLTLIGSEGVPSGLTGADGVFTFSGLPSGAYTLSAALIGFVTQTASVAVSGAESIRLSIILKVGPIETDCPAQPSLDELSVGYSFAQMPGSSSLPVGWTVGFARRMRGRFSYVGEFAGNYRIGDNADAGSSESVHAVSGGVRAHTNTWRFTDFAQLMAGVARTKSSISSTSATYSPTLQLKAGLSYPIPRTYSWEIRAEADLRAYVRAAEDRTGRDYRFGLALVYTRPRFICM